MANLNPQPDCLDFELLPATPLVPNAGSVRLYADATSGDLAAIKADGTSALPGGATFDVGGAVISNTNNGTTLSDSVAKTLNTASITLPNDGKRYAFLILASADFSTIGASANAIAILGLLDDNQVGLSEFFFTPASIPTFTMNGFWTTTSVQLVGDGSTHTITLQGEVLGDSASTGLSYFSVIPVPPPGF